MTQWTLGAERTRLTGRWPVAVLSVYGEDLCAKNFESFNRIAGSVQNHVGGVEIDSGIGAVDIFQESLQNMRGLLSSFERERLPVRGRVIGYAAHHFKDVGIIGMRGVFGDKANVACDTADTDSRRKIANLARALFALLTRCTGNESDGSLH